MITTTLLFCRKKDFQKGFIAFFLLEKIYSKILRILGLPHQSHVPVLYPLFQNIFQTKKNWRKKNRAKNVEFLENRFELQRTCYTFFHAGKSQQVNNINCWKNFHCRAGTIRLTGIKADSLFAALVLVVLTILGLKNRK